MTQGNTTHKKRAISSKHIIISFLVMLVYRGLYQYIIQNVCKPYFFVCSKYRRIDLLIFCLTIILFIVLIYAPTKKIKIIFLSITSIVMIITASIPFGFGVYKADNDGIKKISIITNNELQYEYTDIKTADLYIGSSGWQSKGLSLIYDLYINNEKISICISQSIFDSYDNIVKFDKKIADKRLVSKSDWNIDSVNRKMSEYSNSYFSMLFNNS